MSELASLVTAIESFVALERRIAPDSPSFKIVQDSIVTLCVRLKDANANDKVEDML